MTTVGSGCPPNAVMIGAVKCKPVGSALTQRSWPVGVADGEELKEWVRIERCQDPTFQVAVS